MNFLLWNLNHKNLVKEIIWLVEQHQIDILVLIEYENLALNSLINELGKKGKVFYPYIPKITNNFGNINRILILIEDNLNKGKIELPDNTRICGLEINHPNLRINFLALHYQTKLYWSDYSQNSHVTSIKDYIEIIEENTNNINTILCGDFNMNPFDKGMVQNYGIHGVMDKRILYKYKNFITIDSKKYLYFYNPMWSFLGDLGKGAPGTYFYSINQPVNYYWNIFDQVLIREPLIKYFDEDFLDIITRIEDLDLIDAVMNKYKKKYRNMSDHLPIKFKLNL
ncbi:MAG: hypothetical protein K1X86_04530 [Ignavibacteria bacterium]|nr:hypothetical protein [Ignavibacteria bacterium]